MWQFYSLGSLLAGAFESAADKAGIVHDSAVDSYVATFIRVFLFVVATAAVGFSGLLGEVTFFFHWGYVPLAFIVSISSLLFTYLLRNVEMTVIGAASFITPFLFLFTDTYILGVEFTQLQIIGIVLLVFGGLAFSIDGKTHHFRRDLHLKTSCAILFTYVFAAAVEAYFFKHLHATYNVNAVSFFLFSNGPSMLILFCILLWKGRLRAIYSRATLKYLPYAALGKSFDAFNSTLYITALGMTSLAQVSAFNALMPLALILVALTVQGEFRVSLKEHLDTKRIHWKLGAALVLVVGAFFVA